MGLSNEWISSIVQDPKGFIWIGTQDGLYRYDGYEYQIFRNSPENPQSIAANWIKDITIDSNQNYWLATYGGGITKFSAKNMKFVNFSTDYPFSFKGTLVSKIKPVDKDRLISVSDGGYTLFNIHTNAYKNLGIGSFNRPIAVGTDVIWLVDKNNELFSFHPGEERLQHQFTFDSPIRLLEYIPNIGLLVCLENTMILYKNGAVQRELPVQETFTHITTDSQGNYWIGNAASIYRFDPNHMSLAPIILEPGLLDKGINTFFVDQQQSLWIGTPKGIFKEKKYHEAFDSGNLDMHARRITKHKGTLYVGGAEGLYGVSHPDSIEQLSDRPIMAILAEENAIYAGSDGPSIYKLTGKTIKEIPIPNKGGRLTVLGMVRDQNKRLWVGTWKGIAVYDENDRLLNYIILNHESEDWEAKTTKMHIDTKDRLWIITAANGIYRIDGVSNIDLDAVDARIKNYRYQKENLRSLSSNILVTLEEDRDGNLWFGSDIGIVRYHESNDDFERMYYQGALFDKKIMTLRSDDRNNLWITTINDGIYVYRSEENYLQHFTKNDGLISNAFLYGSGFFDAPDQKIYFGTDEGVQQINLDKYATKKISHTPIITGFNVQSNSGEEIFHAGQIPFMEEVSLTAVQNDFSVRFSALDFLHPEKIQYSYSLDNGNWKTTDLQTAYFTNIPYGNHLLKVRALYDGHSTNDAISQLKINIAPPWYLSTLAKSVYALLLVMACYGIYRYLKWRWTMKLHLQLKEEEAIRLQKLNDFRSKLYTNIAHEFKTPLSLITGPIDQQLTKSSLSESEYSNLAMVKRNAYRMTSLVDQLLQLSKLEEGKLQKTLQKADLGLFLHMISKSFEYRASLKRMHYDVRIDPTGSVWYDEDILEKIVTNLLSNAFKYSPEKGYCGFYVKYEEASVLITVQNTIHESHRLDPEKLFERFYQKDEFAEGIGVGLSLVKELVAFYGGNIEVVFEEKDKLSFKVILPIQEDSLAETDSSDNCRSRIVMATREHDDMAEGKKVINEGERPILLVVEDHAEIRSFIKQSFQTSYRVLEAGNGQVGLRIALEQVPDIIVSDIRMPIMNGIQLCNRLRADGRTSHIPIILLTANNSQEMELTGLDSGADDFVAKPFKIQLLEKRMENLISLRQALRARYNKELVLKPKNIVVSAADELFFEKVQQILDDHLYDPSFNAATFSAKATMSRMQLHRKLLAYTGLSTSAFIRSQRLRQAKRLLKDSDFTISEVGYAVGFSTPTYFMKRFKETFGQTPSEYQVSLKNRAFTANVTIS
ncbi:response regulator [Flavobacteriaceae bacterium TP-CH-4]|uniref:histidine kinase n=1 Tax=Pelagihabitans pacificus TaxID=2696054 RepID=A0A967E6A5_9FLAO|nr:hybrid sensor histidine kinase/response regulator transcription factor [Pelagihabitans pacificus]NHF60302.1 response regulator [Pelagihabitans pacificus]